MMPANCASPRLAALRGRVPLEGPLGFALRAVGVLPIRRQTVPPKPFETSVIVGELSQKLHEGILRLGRLRANRVSAIYWCNEELLYRGVIQHATNTLGAVRSVVWVALLFGLQHAGTGIFFGHSLYDTGTMMISSTASGAAYAAVMLRIGTIWPLAFLHGLENFCNTRSPGDAPWWWYLSQAIFFVLYAAWLLRRFHAT